MSLTQEERNTLITLEMEKAKRFMEQADKCFGDKEWEIAANRYYYACFHAVQALFVKNAIESHKHSGLLRLFGQHFVKTEIIKKEFGPFLTQMEQLRTKADYNVAFIVSEDDLTAMVEPAHELLAEIEKLIISK